MIGQINRCYIFQLIYHRIGIEGMVLDEPRLLEAPRVYDESRTTQIAQVTVRILARIVLDGDVGEQRVAGSLIGWYHIFSQHTIVRQVVDDQSWWHLLLRIAQDVGQPSVQDPQPIATIGAYAKCRDDLRHASCTVLMGFPRGVGVQRWRFARV